MALRVAQAACGFWREHLEERVFGISRDVERYRGGASLPRGSPDPPFSNTCLATVRDALHAENAVTHAEGPKGWTDLSANLDQAVTCRAR